MAYSLDQYYLLLEISVYFSSLHVKVFLGQTFLSVCNCGIGPAGPICELEMSCSRTLKNGQELYVADFACPDTHRGHRAAFSCKHKVFTCRLYDAGRNETRIGRRLSFLLSLHQQTVLTYRLWLRKVFVLRTEVAI